MARGNDGNLLQHATESELFAALIAQAATPQLHAVFTHGMAGYEPLDAPKTPKDEKMAGFLRSKLRLSKEATAASPLILRAYKAADASETAYPNSAVLLSKAAPLSPASIRGVICERDKFKAARLRADFSTGAFAVQGTSWRSDESALGPPDGLSGAWLFSMDPMKFVGGKPTDNDMMTSADWNFLERIWRRYEATGLPGAIALFSYSMTKPERELFFQCIRPA